MVNRTQSETDLSAARVSRNRCNVPSLNLKNDQRDYDGAE